MPNSPAKSVITRRNSSTFTLADIQRLIAESEERVIAHVNRKFEALSSKLETLETALMEVKAVQVSQEGDITHMKDVIVRQQHQLEAFEERERRCNLIISNLPEGTVTFEDDDLEDDVDKVRALVKAIVPGPGPGPASDILGMTRIGRQGGKGARLVKVHLDNVDSRDEILRHCRHLNTEAVRTSFGRIYINKDMSYLRRLEEKRLRLHFKELKQKYPDATKLKNGKLFLGQAIKDQIDYRVQLF